VSLLTWKVIDWTIGARIGPDVEAMGQDVAELGIEAFPEFVPSMDD
jgi:Amt family ammonium transporter